ncbi:hypothetical protein [Gillisia sp. JM1]|uniref:hypothetical protein n=1 Tax=Gillisia sp. JM1 TaxID=1283286 RepID=UPI00040E04CE|nr:hypothetical protein [Gillisia sp. JM1]
MGIISGCIILASLEVSDYINIFSVILNAILAIWIINTIQNRLNNKRVLKDYFINEVKDIRGEYRILLNEIYRSKIKPNKISPWLKLMNIRTNDLMDIILKKHRVSENFLRPYHIDLRNLITEDANFIQSFKLNEEFVLTEKSKKDLIVFQQKNNSLFNKLIIEINDAT